MPWPLAATTSPTRIWLLVCSKKAELNPQRPESFYGGGAEGYTDYPSL